MMLNEQDIVVDDMVVEGYEEIAVNELVVQSEDGNAIAYEDDDGRSVDGDGYGGMPIDLYNDIVEYKRSGLIPNSIDKRLDRSAPSHWRSKCNRFTMADDNETLLYYNPTSPVNDQPKVVIKKGEVRKVLERIHELIGHLGQKRTQIVVLRKLYWRSVRQDVKNFVMSCEFCNQKKVEGKKIVKAPVDITSDNFDISVSVRDIQATNGDRLEFHLVGYNEQDVRDAAFTRMTSYTFKETANEYRSRFSLRDTPVPSFRRQPYVKRNGEMAVGYLLPYQQKNRHIEPEFIEIYEQRSIPYCDESVEYEQDLEDIEGPIEMKRRNTEREETVQTHPITLDGQQLNMKFKEEELDDFDIHNASTNTRVANTTENKTPAESIDEKPKHVVLGGEEEEATTSHQRIEETSSQPKPRLHQEPIRIAYSMKRNVTPNVDYIENRKRSSATTTANLIKKRKNIERPTVNGMAARFSMSVGEANKLDTMNMRNSRHIDTQRQDMLGLSPVFFMPSLDQEVIDMQKELIRRQFSIQKMQEKVMRAQYDSAVRIPMTRYVQSDEPEAAIEMDQEELNVMESQNVYEELPQ